MENNEEFDNINSISIKEVKGYNMSDPNDKFFNDICQFYSSKNNTDVSLEYRRLYYYYPKGNRTITRDPNTINQIFPEPQRNSIFLCFTNILKGDSLFFILILYLLFPVFFIQFLLLFIILCGKYKDASEKTQEKYFNYMERREKIKQYNNSKDLIKNYINDIHSSTYLNQKSKEINDSNNNTRDAFTSFQEEKHNEFNDDKDLDNAIDKDDEKKADDFISKTIEIKKAIREENEIEEDGGDEGGIDESKANNENLNTTGNFQQNEDNFDKDENKEKEDLKQSTIIKKNLNPDEIYTFGGLKLFNVSENNNNEVESIDKIKETDSQKEEKMKYLYDKINNKNQIKKNVGYNNYNTLNNNNNQKTAGTQIKLTNEELSLSGFSLARLEDKRSFKELYYDVLCHCQIIFYFLPNYYIYEDARLITVYYLFKFILYFIVNMFLFNSTSVINQIYDNEFFFSDYFLKSLISVLIVNIIAQFLFFLTNSKRTFIRYINKINNSLFKRKRILKYVIKDIEDLINQNLYLKILFLFALNVFLFIITVYLFMCFCIAYFNTQFYVIKCVFFSVIISQVCPFFLAIIPVKLRKKALNEKNEKLYEISRIIDTYFLP